MENDKPQELDISKIFIKTLKHISYSYYKQTKLDKIADAINNLDIDEFVNSTYNLVNDGVKDTTDIFINSWLQNIQNNLEEQTSKIKVELEKNSNYDEAKFNEQLQKIPNIGDISKEDFINYKKFIKEKIIDKVGLNTEEEIEIFLKGYVDNVVKKLINDATASLPLTLAQLLASIFPFGTEPLVAVNTINNMITGITHNMVTGFVDSAFKKVLLKTGGKRKKKRKSKSKHFYINRIRQTLKQFYNY